MAVEKLSCQIERVGRRRGVIGQPMAQVYARGPVDVERMAGAPIDFQQRAVRRRIGSRSNSRMIIYGLGGSAKEALKLSRFGVNAIFQEPLERPAALKLVKATQMLVLHEFRRYVRIPVATEVSIVAGQNRFSANSVELSSGGMSLKSEQTISNGQPVEISFALLTLPRVWVRGTIVWQKPASKTFGVRFDGRDDRRWRVKEWVDSYLES
jgi:hypothetical protein